MRVLAKLISFIITRRPVLVKSLLFECEAAADATVGEGDPRLLNVYHVPDGNAGRDLDCCVVSGGRQECSWVTSHRYQMSVTTYSPVKGKK